MIEVYRFSVIWKKMKRRISRDYLYYTRAGDFSGTFALIVCITFKRFKSDVILRLISERFISMMNQLSARGGARRGFRRFEPVS